MPNLTPDQTHISWLLAEHLEGMRQRCNHTLEHRWQPPGMAPYWDGTNAGRGWEPVPLTAEGLIDEGRLRRAIEAEGLAVAYLTGKECGWCIGLFPPFEHYSDLAIAFLKAKGVWKDESA